MKVKNRNMFFLAPRVSFSMLKVVEVSVWGADSEVRTVWLTTLLGPVAPLDPVGVPSSLKVVHMRRLIPAQNAQ